MAKSTRGKEKRDALVGACAELFWQRGYANTSIADIAGHAGIPVGNVYYYFRSKAEMADAVAAVFVAETESLIGDIGARLEPYRLGEMRHHSSRVYAVESNWKVYADAMNKAWHSHKVRIGRATEVGGCTSSMSAWPW